MGMVTIMKMIKRKALLSWNARDNAECPILGLLSPASRKSLGSIWFLPESYLAPSLTVCTDWIIRRTLHECLRECSGLTCRESTVQWQSKGMRAVHTNLQKRRRDKDNLSLQTHTFLGLFEFFFSEAKLNISSPLEILETRNGYLFPFTLRKVPKNNNS